MEHSRPLNSVRIRQEVWEDAHLSPHSSRSGSSAGRAVPEPPDDLRTAFQRDRDRVVHSNSFRRLKHKTQVFVAPVGDHFVTRLTHTLEVMQVGRTIARALRLNEDLVEAAALAHDLGHTPFGHIGEQVLDDIFPGGFRHNEQSLRTVDLVEKKGAGLNLTVESRDAILHHSKPRGEFLDSDELDRLSLEAQVVRVADAIAYLNHDIGDALRAGLLTEEELPSDAREVLGTRHAQRVDSMVRDVVETSRTCDGLDGAAPPPGQRHRLSMSAQVARVVTELREFMFQRVYLPAGEGPEGVHARAIVEFLYEHYNGHPALVPVEYQLSGDPAERSVLDYIAGMTDYFAISAAEEVKPGISGDVFNGRV